MNAAETREALQERISPDEFIAIERKDDRRVIGNIYLGRREFNAREIDYLLRRDCWGRGYAHEACQALHAEAYAQGVHRVFAKCDPLNPASWHLLERLGFRREAHLRQNVFFHRDADGSPIWKDTFIYVRLHTDS